MAENLFKQVEGLQRIGPRLSGEAEVLHDIEDYFRSCSSFPIVRNQIRVILELVPDAFAENWQSPETYEEMTEPEKQAYAKIARSGLLACPGPYIQAVIELAVQFREKYQQPAEP